MLSHGWKPDCFVVSIYKSAPVGAPPSPCVLAKEIYRGYDEASA